MGSVGVLILILPMDLGCKLMALEASWERTARRPGLSSPADTITRTVWLVSRLVMSTIEFRGKELVAA
jgi:hypothetical protein